MCAGAQCNRGVTGVTLSAARPVEEGSPALEKVCDRNAGLDFCSICTK